MCLSIGAMVNLATTIVPRLAELINVLFTFDMDIANLQAKLYEEISKIKGLGDEEIYDATSILTTKHDLLRVFFTLSITLKKDMSSKGFLMGCSLIILSKLLHLCSYIGNQICQDMLCKNF